MEPSRETRTSVLVICNDAAVRDMLANLLSGEGFHVALAESGTEALKIASNASFDTALVELFLPTSPASSSSGASPASLRRPASSSCPPSRRSEAPTTSFGSARPTSSSTRGRSSSSSARLPRPPRGPGAVVEDERLKKCLIDTVDVLVSLLELDDPFFGETPTSRWSTPGSWRRR